MRLLSSARAPPALEDTGSFRAHPSEAQKQAPRQATRLVAASPYEWDPSLRPGPVRGIFSPERPFEPRLVVQNPPLEPHCASNKQDERKPRPERKDEARHEDEVAEIHRITRVAIWAGRDDLLRHCIHAGRSACTRQSVIPNQTILQIPPCQQRSAPWRHGQSAATKRELECNDEQRAYDERMHGRPLQPLQNLRAYRLGRV